MSDSQWPNRLYSLDVSRGLASLAVVLFHWSHFSWANGALGIPLPDHTVYSQPIFGILKLFYTYGSYGVDYFFLLSGFIFFWLYKDQISNRSVSFLKFWIQRFSRLYPLHFATLGLVALLQLYYSKLTGNPFIYIFNDAYHLVLHLTFTYWWGFQKGWSFNHPVWSVSVEIFLYLAFFILAFRQKTGPLLSIGVSAVGFVAYQYFGSRFYLGFAMFFWGGTLFYMVGWITNSRTYIKWIVNSIAISSWLLVITNVYFFDIGASLENQGTIANALFQGFPGYILFGSTLCVLAICEIDKGPLLQRFAWIGDITYSTYLLHFPLNIIFASAVALDFLDANFYRNPIYLILYLIILIPLSYMVFLYFERPMQKIIRTKFIKRKNQRT